MKRIFVCSPYAGDVELNELIAETLCHQLVKMGYENFQEEREIGIRTGLTFLDVCDEVWVYTGNGISPGMEHEIEYAETLGKPVVMWAGEEIA